jgi:serine protease Do
MKRLLVLIAILVVVLGLVSAGQKYLPQLQNYLHTSQGSFLPQSDEKVKVVQEESKTIDIVKKAGSSVVTVSETLSSSRSNSPFGGFDQFPFFGSPDSGGNEDTQPQSIGSGFIISKDGLIVTNKHVVSDTAGKYQIITSDDKKYDVQKIYRDPLNDLAIVKIDPGQNSSSLQPIELGDSSHLQVGQSVVAIGTALGEFRNTVTTGVISGLSRGITAGSPFEGSVERLDNVIQTDAAINPGNSGGPLLNSAGQVIGINTAVSQSGQNIGFAIPINVIKDSVKNFNETGQFDRPYLGVEYRIISRDLAIMNNLPEGAYIQGVVQGSPADKGGLQRGDIVTKIDGKAINEKNQLSTAIAQKKVGDTITVSFYRDDENKELKITLETVPQ